MYLDYFIFSIEMEIIENLIIIVLLLNWLKVRV
jgi:hypothetical protein